jgi:hypothetical protein
VMRIPSSEQPEVEEIIKREHIREDDAVTLVSASGSTPLTNPFRLRAAQRQFAGNIYNQMFVDC